jgi:hypothetical protein
MFRMKQTQRGRALSPPLLAWRNGGRIGAQRNRLLCGARWQGVFHPSEPRQRRVVRKHLTGEHVKEIAGLLKQFLMGCGI